MQEFLTNLKSFISPTVVVLVLVGLLLLNRYIFSRIKSGKASTEITRGLVALLLVLLAILAFILVLPIDQGLKGQLLGFLGIVVSAGIALSSTTLLGNLIAGLMNNSMDRFRNGDLISIDNLQGRVTKRSVFHTEIQLEDSNFVTLPNLFIASNPVKLTRKTNTVISATVSLGYDVPRAKVEESLKEAAHSAGLTDPYVYILSLGDYSVVYKIHGFLEDSGRFFSVSSLLNGMVMDTLHKNRIEIVSPTFMNQRRVDEREFIPDLIVEKSSRQKEESPEDLIFDRAKKSEKIEQKREYLAQIEEKTSALKEKLREKKGTEEAGEIKSSMERWQNVKKAIEEDIRQREEKLDEEGSE